MISPSGVYTRLDPTPCDLVQLNSFKATSLKNRVLLEWETTAEPDSLGFYIWRGIPLNGNCSLHKAHYTDITLLNKPDGKPRLFDNDGTDTTGERYFHVDYEVTPQTTYCYLLQDVKSDGQTTTEYWDHLTLVTTQNNSCGN